VQLKETTENHEERITELEIKATGIEEEQTALQAGVQDVKDANARIENNMKEGDLENKVRIDHVNDEMSQFCNGVLKDLEYLEQKIAEAIANQPVYNSMDTNKVL
jgi:phage shock protein A